MSIIIKHRHTKFNKKHILGLTTKIYEFETPSELKHILRNMKDMTTFYFIPENCKSSDATIKPLHYLDKNTFINMNAFNESKSGIFYLLRCAGAFKYTTEQFGMSCIIDLFDWLECENEDVYDKLFDGWGTYNFNPSLDTNLYLFTINKIQHIYNKDYNTNIQFNITLFNSLTCLHFDTFFDNIERIHTFYALSDDWFMPSKRIKNDVDKMIQLNPELEYVALHVRSRVHFKTDISEDEFFNVFVEHAREVCSVPNRMCIVFGDNKFYTTTVENLLKKYDIPFLDITNVRANAELCKKDVDWCEEPFTFQKYIGAMYDAYLMSRCEHIIGGKSNFSLYSMNLNPKQKIHVPSKLYVDVH